MNPRILSNLACDYAILIPTKPTVSRIGINHPFLHLSLKKAKKKPIESSEFFNLLFFG